MKKKAIWILFVFLAAAAILGTVLAGINRPRPIVSPENGENYGALLTDLVNAWETPSEENARAVRADLEAIRKTNAGDAALAESIADHWQRVYVDPEYELFCYHGDDSAPELAAAGIPDSPTHAIVVLGFALADGEMQPELRGRCDAAAAMAKAFPETILVCSGGATGENNPDGHTEAGLMKEYLTEERGIDPGRIFTDEAATTTAENAVNTFAILEKQGVRTMTIVTSAYHQRRGQTLYHLLAELYRREHGYSAEIVGNYCLEIEPSTPALARDGRIAVRQMGEILGLPEEVLASLPSMRPPQAPGND